MLLPTIGHDVHVFSTIVKRVFLVLHTCLGSSRQASDVDAFALLKSFHLIAVLVAVVGNGIYVSYRWSYSSHSIAVTTRHSIRITGRGRGWKTTPQHRRADTLLHREPSVTTRECLGQQA